MGWCHRLICNWIHGCSCRAWECGWWWYLLESLKFAAFHLQLLNQLLLVAECCNLILMFLLQCLSFHLLPEGAKNRFLRHLFFCVTGSQTTEGQKVQEEITFIHNKKYNSKHSSSMLCYTSGISFWVQIISNSKFVQKLLINRFKFPFHYT